MANRAARRTLEAHLNPLEVCEANTLYPLGHTAHELARLARQARLIDPITRRFLAAAGVGQGMRVLDLGSGVGDTAFLLAECVGDSGEVIGVERSAEALGQARRRAAEKGLRHVHFVAGDFAHTRFERAFDAVLGRYVLVFQPDPVAALRAAATQVRPGGVLLFHEVDFAGERASPVVPAYERACRWVVEALARGGSDPAMGARLHASFRAAGLPAPTLQLEALLGGDAVAADLLRSKCELVETLLPEILRHEVASAEEVGIANLCERMLHEAQVRDALIVGRSEIGAWVRKPH
ncbi:Aklanonic acid methyltransferase DauC [Burkholderiales bacterium]|nr:MAG: class I SAM-dependent methyltransferase [Burkholderiales bacterium]CAG1011898.1 Aklanonic acid methyltransferase DauC [Burkholderiales bacterium]